MRAVFLCGICTLLGRGADAYPTDPPAQEITQIRRLKWQQDINEGKRKGTRLPPGAQLPLAAIELRMLANQDFDLTPETPKDPALQEGLEGIVAKWRWRRYNIAVLEISDPKKPRWAGINETALQTPGSTAKVLLAAGMLQALADRFGDRVDKRRAMLTGTSVTADPWAMPNHHEVPVIIGDVQGEDYKTWIRSVRTGDTFTLYEWMDHALSPSSNASASMLWREATLMRLLGAQYPPAKWDAELFARWDRETFTKAAFETVDAPLVHAGLQPDDFFIRMFFTHGANRYVKAEESRASPLGFVRWLLRMEQGRMVDEFSSLELKRLLYLTRRRIRYAVAPELDGSAVFFKTGSLYKCKPEEGYTCGAYRGNEVNVLNAMIIVETPKGPDGGAPDGAGGSIGGTVPTATATGTAVDKVYLVGVMSNELKRNAAEDHARLASEIHALITLGGRPAAAPP